MQGEWVVKVARLSRALEKKGCDAVTAEKAAAVEDTAMRRTTESIDVGVPLVFFAIGSLSRLLIEVALVGCL